MSRLRVLGTALVAALHPQRKRVNIMVLQPGHTIPGTNFLVRKKLGEGASGIVFLAIDTLLQRLVAVKVVPRTNDPVADQKLLREARVVAGLQHPNIITLHQVHESPDEYYFITTYAPLGSLRDAHPQGTRLPPAVVVEYVRQIASGLQYAHDQGIIHRDIKPENLLVPKQGEILVADFGIAHHYHPNDTARYTILGTQDYASAEQVAGRAVPASDQLSLALVVYEWLCGFLPEQPLYLLKALNLVIKPLDHSGYGVVSTATWLVLKKALSDLPQDRHPTVQIFAEALEQSLNTGRAQAVPGLAPAQPSVSPSVLPTRTITCRYCQTVNGNQKFCQGCGMMLSTPPAKPAVSLPASSGIQGPPQTTPCGNCSTLNSTTEEWCVNCGLSLSKKPQATPQNKATAGQPALSTIPVPVVQASSPSILLAYNNEAPESRLAAEVKRILAAAGIPWYDAHEPTNHNAEDCTVVLVFLSQNYVQGGLNHPALKRFSLWEISAEQRRVYYLVVNYQATQITSGFPENWICGLYCKPLLEISSDERKEILTGFIQRL